MTVSSKLYNPAMRRRFLHLPAVCFFFLLSAGCKPASSAATEFPSPVRWQSPTVSPSRFFPTREVSLTPTLAPTPTPRTYTVRAGDTFGSIAAKFGTTVDALIKANPNVDPNALPIGAVLVIPPPTAGSETPPPTPTPIALKVGPPYCYAQPGEGKWCLTLVENPGPDAVAGVFLRFSLYESVSIDPSASQDVALPITLLLAGMRTVAAAFFPPEQAKDEIARVELISAVRTADTSALLPVAVLKEDGRPLSDGLEMAVEFRIDGDLPANRLDAVLTLLDASGRPIGCRILHEDGNWTVGPTHHLTLDAFTLAGEIGKYELILQARAVIS
jgi:LysM repeat protein